MEEGGGKGRKGGEGKGWLWTPSLSPRFASGGMSTKLKKTGFVSAGVLHVSKF